MIRRCSKCGTEKELNIQNFHKKNTGIGGFASQCKACKREYDQQRYSRNREKISQAKATYYQNNKATLRKSQLAYYYANREKCRHASNRWQRENPIRRRMTCEKSRSLKQGGAATLSENEWAMILEEFHNSCAYCGITEKESLTKYGELLHQEHVIPLSIGGPYSLGNVVPSCRSCNSSKTNHDFVDWYRHSKQYDEAREQHIVAYVSSIKQRS